MRKLWSLKSKKFEKENLTRLGSCEPNNQTLCGSCFVAFGTPGWFVNLKFAFP